MNNNISKKSKNARNNKRRQNTNNKQDHIVRLSKHIIPDEVIVPLRYYWSTVVLNNTGQRTASHQFQVNGVFDIDASLGSTSAVGFQEWQTMFSRYRALKFSIKSAFVNADGIPSFCAIALTNTSFATNAFNQSYWGDDYVRWCPLGQNTGVDASVMKLTATAAQIVGDPSVTDDADYAALVSANPAKLIYAEIALDSGSAAFTMTSGCLVRFELTILTRFYQRIFLAV